MIQTLRGLGWLTAGATLRLLREGLVLRALAWPGLLCAVALIGAAAVVGALGQTPRLSVAPEVASLARPLEAAGFTVSIEEAATGPALWREGEALVLRPGPMGRDAARAEAAVRAAVGAPWTLAQEAPPARPTDAGAAAGALAGLVGLLYALYGVVLGAGAVHRDREGGTWEADLTLPLPFWVHAAARGGAASAVLSAGLGLTLQLLHGLIALPDLAGWVLAGVAASLGGVALGLAAMGGAGAAFSSGLSRALTLALALAGLGWAAPDVAAVLPIASLTAGLRGAPSGSGALALGALGLGLAVARHRRGLS